MRYIRPISKAREAEMRRYKKAKKEWWPTVKGNWCPVMLAIFGEYVRVGKSPHHRRGRLSALLCDVRWWMAVSEKGHDWIHRNPIVSRSYGWLCKAGDWNTPPKL